jgi:PadR family transcriptional regulator, regulatory protein PadR
VVAIGSNDEQHRGAARAAASEGMTGTDETRNPVGEWRFPLHFYKSDRISCRSERGRRMTDDRLDLPQGTLDLLILKAVSLGPQHGWAISERIHDVSRATLQVPQGSLYPALHRLERRGWIRARWGTSDNNRRAKYYELTASGRRQLDAEADAWRRLTMAVALVMEMS